MHVRQQLNISHMARIVCNFSVAQSSLNGFEVVLPYQPLGDKVTGSWHVDLQIPWF